MRCALLNHNPAAVASFPTYAVEPAKMLMNAKQFQECVKEEPASTQMDLMSADVLLVISRVKHLRNVKTLMNAALSLVFVMEENVPTQLVAIIAFVLVDISHLLMAYTVLIRGQVHATPVL